MSFNAGLNGIERVRFGQAGWAGGETGLGRFDLLIGSDLLYDRHSVTPLVDFVAHHVCRHGEVLIVDPGRGLTRRFTREMIARGFDADVRSTTYEAHNRKSTDYWVLRFTKLES